jgi:DNA invertase Pin-like site-specific DNA recombinase
MRVLAPLALLLAVLVAAAVPTAAGAQSGDDPPTELWKEYPLDETAPTNPPDAELQEGPVPQAQPVPAEKGGGGGLSQAALLGLGLLALMVATAAALGVVARVRRRREQREAEARSAPAKPAPVRPGPPPPEPASGRPVAVPAANGSAARPALGYTTVSAPGEAERARLRDEAKLIQAACQEHDLVLGKLVRDLESHAGPDLRRPGLSYVLDRLAAKEYGCLVVSRLDRLTRSAANLGALMRMLSERGARLIVIDIGLDTGTADGRIAAEALVTVGGLDEKKIEERTRKGLEAARSGRRASGRPAVADRPSLQQRIVQMRASGMTLQAIADTLNAEGVPTVRGGAEWRPSSVQAAAGYKRPKRGRGSDN